MPYILINIYLLYYSIRNPRRISFIALTLITFIITTTYYNGSDWRTYEILYDDPESFDLYMQWEPGLKYLFNFFSFAGFNFHLSLILLKVANIIYVTWFIFKYSKNRMIAYAIFITTCGYGLYIDNPLRQMLAVPLFLMALQFIINKKLFKFLLTIIIGAQFHFSILIFVPLYFMVRLKMRILSWVLAILPIVVVLLFVVVNIFPYYLDAIPIAGYYTRHYTSGDINLRLSVTAIFASILYYVILFLQKSERPNVRPDDIFRLCSFLFLINYILGSLSEEILRFIYYLGIPYSIYLANRSDKIGKSLVLTVLCAHIIQSTQMIYYSYKFIPYTNYIWSVFVDDLKSYGYRANFHLFINADAVQKK